MYIVLVFGETCVDMYKLKTGGEVPIFKFDDDWTFGNLKEMVTGLIKEAVDWVEIPIVSVVQELTGSPNGVSLNSAVYSKLYELLNDYNTGGYYSVGILYGVAVRQYFGEAGASKNKDAYTEIIDAISAQADVEMDKGITDMSKPMQKAESDIESRIKGKSTDYIRDKLFTETVIDGYYKYSFTYEEQFRAEITTLTITQHNDVFYALIGDDLYEIDIETLEATLDHTIYEEYFRFSYEEEGVITHEVPLFTDDGEPDGIGMKILKAIMPSISYSDHLWILLLLVSTDELSARMGDLITLNLSNARLNKGRSGDKQALSVDDIVDLSKAYTAFRLDTDAEMNYLFMSSIFTRWNFDAPGLHQMSIRNARGY